MKNYIKNKKDMEYIDEDENLLLKLKSNVDTSYYNLDHPISDSEKEKYSSTFCF